MGNAELECRIWGAHDIITLDGTLSCRLYSHNVTQELEHTWRWVPDQAAWTGSKGTACRTRPNRTVCYRLNSSSFPLSPVVDDVWRGLSVGVGRRWCQQIGFMISLQVVKRWRESRMRMAAVSSEGTTRNGKMFVRFSLTCFPSRWLALDASLDYSRPRTLMKILS